VFRGRLKAVLVKKDTHFLDVCRYVVLNPVRAQDGPASTAVEME
jgi:putative transposase